VAFDLKPNMGGHVWEEGRAILSAHRHCLERQSSLSAISLGVRGMLSIFMTRTTKRTAPLRANSPPNRLRIIGGRWRGVPIAFPPLPEVRPTPDRVRETLFNWLQPTIVGASCLDMFAGSGALGFEALSRGAERAVLVDRDSRLAQHLREMATKLRAEEAEIVTSDAIQYLRGAAQPFDIVFLDPPYASNLLPEVCSMLTQGWLAPNALVYLETPAEAGLPPLPMSWSMHRSKRAGQVGYHLLRTSM
jgi:16S rRNA (guanine966-N2)-methyltransferase